MENQETITGEQAEKIVTKKNWLEEENKNLAKTAFDEDRKPAIKFKENVITDIEVDFSEPFEEWFDDENNTTKKILPVKVAEGEFVWWLNVRNPIYKQIVELGLKGQNKFKILQTGSQKNTRYAIVK